MSHVPKHPKLKRLQKIDVLIMCLTKRKVCVCVCVCVCVHTYIRSCIHFKENTVHQNMVKCLVKLPFNK